MEKNGESSYTSTGYAFDVSNTTEEQETDVAILAQSFMVYKIGTWKW